MSEQFWFLDEQVERPAPRFPRSRGKARMDDCWLLSGIIQVQRNGMRWTQCLCGPRVITTGRALAG